MSCSAYQSVVAAAGALPEPLKATSSDRPPSAISAKQSPPIPVEPGSTTPCTAHAATAASKAFPPDCRMLTAASVERGWEVAAIPCRATTTERPEFSKSLMSAELWPSTFVDVPIVTKKNAENSVFGRLARGSTRPHRQRSRPEVEETGVRVNPTLPRLLRGRPAHPDRAQHGLPVEPV